MTDIPLPAVALAAVPRRRQAALDLAREIERRDFAGIYCASVGDNLGFSLALAMATERIPLGTAIANIYTRIPSDFAGATALIHELSGGRFRFGVGVSHTPMLERMGVSAGRPLSDMRAFVEAWRNTPRTGEQPPIVLATLRKKMVALGGEVADGIVWANGARSHMRDSLAALPDAAKRREDFFVGYMIPTVISDDVAGAPRSTAARSPSMSRCRTTATTGRRRATSRRWRRSRRRWPRASAIADSVADERCLALGLHPVRPGRERARGLAAWYDAGVCTPILVPSSVEGNQMKAFEELFAIF